jgi:hypothetical protein
LSKVAKCLLSKTTRLKRRSSILRLKEQCYSLSTTSLAAKGITSTSSKNLLLFSDLALDKEAGTTKTLLLSTSNYSKKELHKVKQILKHKVAKQSRKNVYLYKVQ